VNTATGVIIVGAIAVGAYFVINSTSQPTNQGSDFDISDPSTWLSPITSPISDAVNVATNEVNTILIILAFVVVGIIALLAFGPGGEHISKAASVAFL
jgi:hypothetical protein